jgi:hypothetical protein
MTASDDWSTTGGNTGLDENMRDSAGWPWLPGYSYFLFVTNSTASTQPFSFAMYGIEPQAGAAEFTTISLLPANGGVQLSMWVVPDWTYNLQYSPDLVNWYNIYSFTPTTTNVTYTDTTQPSGQPTRYYRLSPQ